MAYPMRLDNPTAKVDGKWILPSAIFKCIGTQRSREYQYIEFSQLTSADTVKGRYRIVQFGSTFKLVMLRGEDGWQHDQQHRLDLYYRGWDLKNVWRTWTTESREEVEYYHVWMGDIVRVEPVGADGVYNIVYAKGRKQWNMEVQLDDPAHDLLASFLGDMFVSGRTFGDVLDSMEKEVEGAAAAAAAADTTEAVCTLRF